MPQIVTADAITGGCRRTVETDVWRTGDGTWERGFCPSNRRRAHTTVGVDEGNVKGNYQQTRGVGAAEARRSEETTNQLMKGWSRAFES
jgi:hypothetical protein